jgi:hypothetical protein
MAKKIDYKPRDPSIWPAHLQAKAICAEHNNLLTPRRGAETRGTKSCTRLQFRYHP